MLLRIGAGALSLGLCGTAIIFSLFPQEDGNDAPAPAAVGPVTRNAYTSGVRQPIEPDTAAAAKREPPMATASFLAVPAPPVTLRSETWPPVALPPKAGLLAVLAVALMDDKEGLLSTRAVIDGFPKPTHGDLALAHEKGEAGANAVKENQQETAIALLTQAVQADPGDAALRNELGQAFMNFGKFDEAQNALVESVTLDSGRASAWVNLGVLLARQGDQNMAKAAFVASVVFSRPEEKAIDYVAAVSRWDNDSAPAVAAALALESRIVRTTLTTPSM